MSLVALSFAKLCSVQKNLVTRLQKLNFSLSEVCSKSRDVDLPKFKGGKAGKFRRIVHYPEEYTVKPLSITRLGGRDPKSGRLVVKGIGGGIKRKYHWVEWNRQGPTEGPPLVEKVIEIIVDWCRTSRVALVAGGDKMKYYLATENMKPGDLIRTCGQIPRIPVAAKEGDAHPLGALPVGTPVHCIEKFPGKGGVYVKAAGTNGIVSRRVGNRIIVQLPSKNELSLPEECMATVGRLSNVDHGNTPIGSAQRNRELGNRPRSGLWQRKGGQHGRKIRPLPPVKILDLKTVEKDFKEIHLSLKNDMHHHNKLY